MFPEKDIGDGANKSIHHKLEKKFWLAKQKLIEADTTPSKHLGKLLDTPDTAKCEIDFDDTTHRKLREFSNLTDASQRHAKILAECFKICYKLSSLERKMCTSIVDLKDHFQEHNSQMATNASRCFNVTSLGYESLARTLEGDAEGSKIFYEKSVCDTVQSIEQLKSAKINLNASLKWFSQKSKRIDPEKQKEIKKFKGVQCELKDVHREYKKLCDDVCTKISLIQLSSNHFAYRKMKNYFDILEQFFHDSSEKFREFNDSYQGRCIPYNFVYLRDTLGEDNGVSVHQEQADSSKDGESKEELFVVSDLIDLEEYDDYSEHSNKATCNPQKIGDEKEEDIFSTKSLQTQKHNDVLEQESNTTYTYEQLLEGIDQLLSAKREKETGKPSNTKSEEFSQLEEFFNNHPNSESSLTKLEQEQACCNLFDELDPFKKADSKKFDYSC